MKHLSPVVARLKLHKARFSSKSPTNTQHKTWTRFSRGLALFVYFDGLLLACLTVLGL